MGKFTDALKKSQTAKAPKPPTRVKERAPGKGRIKEVQGTKADTSIIEEPKETGTPPAEGMDTRLRHFLEADSAAAECFKLLRAKILTLKEGARPRAIMVTSPEPLDGKSTVAVNIAIHIALGLNEHVLLVDCDLRRPSLGKLLGVNSYQGLSTYLQEDISLSDHLIKTQIDKLTLLPGGRRPQNPSELLSSEKMRHLVEELKSRYPDRYIIFDTTPAGGAAETTSLSHMMDAILLVVRAGKTPKERILKAIENLDRDRILGVVFNASDEPLKDHSYYYGYYRKPGKR